MTHLAAKKFLQIDGTQWAASFAFNAFFSLSPLIILFVTVASFFVDRDRAERSIVTYVEGYVPLDGEMRTKLFDALAGVVHARQRAGIFALLLLIWAALQCFITLVLVSRRAWDDKAFNWWRLPLRGMMLLGVTAGAVLVGIAAPALASIGKSWLFPANEFGAWLYALWGFVVPMLVLFLSLTLFYKWAPHRKTRFSEVWIAAACVTVLLQTTASLFVLYLEHSATLNALYGVFGGIMALLLWIYLSGCGLIFGSCLCAAQAQVRSAPRLRASDTGRLLVIRK